MQHDARLVRIIDASLNRAGEGLRVIEDFVRLALDAPQLTKLAKSLRHELASVASELPAMQLPAARDTLRDVGTGITTETEAARADPWHVCAANFKRLEQSLRSLEEYGKLIDSQWAAKLKALRYRVYTLEKVVSVAFDSRQRLADARLMVLSDGGASAADFERLVIQLVNAGVHAIQLRDKRLDDRTLLARARMLCQLCQHGHDVPTLAVVNDRADLAMLAGADITHLGQQDLNVKDARTVVGAQMLIGVSTHDLGQAQAAVLDGAHYLGAGPTFASSTKPFDHFAGLEYLRDAAAEIGLPIFAIGGITPENIHQVLDTGVGRVAVGAAITMAKDPAGAASRLLDALNSAVR